MNLCALFCWRFSCFSSRSLFATSSSSPTSASSSCSRNQRDYFLPMQTWDKYFSFSTLPSHLQGIRLAQKLNRLYCFLFFFYLCFFVSGVFADPGFVATTAGEAGEVSVGWDPAAEVTGVSSGGFGFQLGAVARPQTQPHDQAMRTATAREINTWRAISSPKPLKANANYKKNMHISISSHLINKKMKSLEWAFFSNQ